MASTANITCQACGTPEEVPARWHKQRRYCTLCQILRDYEVMKSRNRLGGRNCEVCEAEFFPLRTGWKMCGECSQLGFPEDQKVQCVICDERGAPAPGTSSTCLTCVQASKLNRHAYLKHVYQLRPSRKRAA